MWASSSRGRFNFPLNQLDKIAEWHILYVYPKEKAVPQSTVFKSNRSQAVRIPKDVALPEHVKRVDVIKQGSARLIIPAGESWDVFFAGPKLDDDFLEPRVQPALQRRDDL
jgi:antitoxin VapB